MYFEHLSAIMEKCIVRLLFIFSLSNLPIEASDIQWSLQLNMLLCKAGGLPLLPTEGRCSLLGFSLGSGVLMVLLGAAHHFVRNKWASSVSSGLSLFPQCSLIPLFCMTKMTRSQHLHRTERVLRNLKTPLINSGYDKVLNRSTGAACSTGTQTLFTSLQFCWHWISQKS